MQIPCFISMASMILSSLFSDYGPTLNQEAILDCVPSAPGRESRSDITSEKSLASRTPARLPELAHVVDNDLPVAYLFACPWSVESNV